MMTKSLLNTFGIDQNLIKDIHWKTNESTVDSILIYKFNKADEKEIEAFKKRIMNSDFLACLINKEIPELPQSVFVLGEDDFVLAQEEILNNLYPVSSHLKLIGITGTNGKTTTVDMIRQICIKHKKSVLTIGTLGVYQNSEKVKDFNLTSPSYIDLRKVLSEFGPSSEFVAMELSSHALDQNRIGSLKFCNIGWTNISQDHLDYHGTMENYILQKKKVYDLILNNGKITMPSEQRELAETIGKENDTVFASIPLEIDNSLFKINYNRQNLAVATNILSSHFEVDVLSFKDIISPPGRLSIIEFKAGMIIIDYAHTPDAITSITKELRKNFSDKKLITLFGCGGDRDTSKRPLMARAACENSDYVFLTSDNPRFEEPQQIIDDIKVGMDGNFEIIIDRAQAIKCALSMVGSGILLIAGKGHENYLDIRGVKHPYSDSEIVQEFIRD